MLRWLDHRSKDSWLEDIFAMTTVPSEVCVCRDHGLRRAELVYVGRDSETSVLIACDVVSGEVAL